MKPIESKVPAGWKFNSADFSIRAGDGTSVGHVMLKRDRENVARWLCLDDNHRAKHPLYIVGTADTFIEALENAIWQAKQHPQDLPVATFV